MEPAAQTPQQPGPSLVRDFGIPKTETSPSGTAAGLRAELVQDIPIRKLDDTAQTPHPKTLGNPVIQPTMPKTNSAESQDDKELDMILQDVNSSVKSAENSGKVNQAQSKAAAQKSKPVAGRASSPPIAATMAACLAALILIASAVLLFKQGQ